MDNINKNVLAALTDNPTHLFADFLRFLESTQPTTVTSSSSPNVTSSAATTTITCAQSSAITCAQPSAGWILQLSSCNVVKIIMWLKAGQEGASDMAHVPPLMSIYTPLAYAVK
ncbi:uncharacterized protein LOC136076724 isoform X3 [Hydra vulgaris]|uniref:Uncharacterized protein LOC136076724 isoform X3 n=1 Tax=Hydra vulgaris TaxID=6087 RepID=A0ABM4BB99_HYDVU